MICSTPEDLQAEVNAGRSIVSVRANLVETITAGKDVGDDNTGRAITRSLDHFAGTRHALRVGRKVAARLVELAGQSAVPAPVVVVEGVEDETDVEDEDDDLVS